jgi:hypothetical protein
MSNSERLFDDDDQQTSGGPSRIVNRSSIASEEEVEDIQHVRNDDDDVAETINELSSRRPIIRTIANSLDLLSAEERNNNNNERSTTHRLQQRSFNMMGIDEPNNNERSSSLQHRPIHSITSSLNLNISDTFMVNHRDMKQLFLSPKRPITAINNKLCSREGCTKPIMKAKKKCEDCEGEEDQKQAHRKYFEPFNGILPQLSIDELANILGFFGPMEIMCFRRVCNNWKDAARITTVPMTPFVVGLGFRVSTLEKYQLMCEMTRALPNLQQIELDSLGIGHKYVDGDDANEEELGRSADYITYEIELISNFRRLKDLELRSATLNGRYPFLFNFPCLEKLVVSEVEYLNWDFTMLEGLPNLKELILVTIPVKANIRDLRVVKDTLELLHVHNCPGVEGNFMDLADFPNLIELNIVHLPNHVTPISGDIRDIGENDFPAIERLLLPPTVYGGDRFEFRQIEDVHSVMETACRLIDVLVSPFIGHFIWRLSSASSDWYGNVRKPAPPFLILLVKAGPRVGYRWCSPAYGFAVGSSPCEINWMPWSPEPDRESSDYETYIQELQELEKEKDLFKGFYQPPTQEEYDRLIEALPPEEDNTLSGMLLRMLEAEDD